MRVCVIGVLGASLALLSCGDDSVSGGGGAAGTAGVGGAAGAAGAAGVGGTAGAAGSAGAGGSAGHAGSAGATGAAGAAGAGGAGGSGGACVCDAAGVTNTGHRGTGVKHAAYPENTIVSLLQAFSEGADMVELDVMHSADGVLVLMHDDTVDRTTDGRGCTGNLSVAELQALDAAAGTDLQGSGVTVPTLAEVFQAVDGALDIELKMDEGSGCPATDRGKMAADVVALVQADAKTRRIMLSSFDIDVLDQVKALDASIEIGYLSVLADVIPFIATRGFTGVNLRHSAVDAQVVSDAHAAGLDVNVWTVNLETDMQTMLDYGVDMIITDEPDLLDATSAARCAAQCP